MAILEDYADVCQGLLALYEATFDERWFVAAQSFAEVIIAQFSYPSGGFYDTSEDHETLITRPRSLQDNVIPSGQFHGCHCLAEAGCAHGRGPSTGTSG